MELNASKAQWVLFAAVAAGTSYLVSVALGGSGPWAIVWKGSGVALLAAYAAVTAQDRNGWLLASVMAFGAAGDVLLDAVSLEAGAAAFAVGHMLAGWLYLGNRRENPTGSQRALALALLMATPVTAWGLTHSVEVSIYASVLGLMAATAWLSRFSRYRTGIGAVLFVVSDLLIFARMGPLGGPLWVSLAIWAFYFAGQSLIVVGVKGASTNATGRASFRIAGSDPA